MNTPLTTTPIPRTEPCHARFEIDEGITFTCAFSYPKRETSPANLSEELSAAQGNDWETYRAHLGAAEFSFSRYQSADVFSLDEIYAHTNPARWVRTPLTPPPANAPASTFTFSDAPEGETVFTLTDECGFKFDENAARLRLVFAAGMPITGWHQIADCVFIGMNEANQLIALQIEGVAL